MAFETLTKGAKTPGQFVAKLLHSATQAHISHLITSSYAAHKNLNEYYDAIPGLVDEFAEAYQGKYGKITGYGIGVGISEANDVKSYITYFKELHTYVEEYRATLKDSDLQNITDEILSLIKSTLYKFSLT